VIVQEKGFGRLKRSQSAVRFNFQQDAMTLRYAETSVRTHAGLTVSATAVLDVENRE
jgi:hypothetical protein